MRRPAPHTGRTSCIQRAKAETNWSAARLLVKDVLDRRQGTLSYEWINTELHETEPRQKLAEFSEFKDWQWIVISTTYVDEFMGQANHLQRLFAAGILLTTVAIILGLNLAI